MAHKHLLLVSAVALALGAPALAKVPPDQAARLGKDLTPLGAETAGTGDVPAFTGGMQAPPPGISFDPKKQQPPNPWPGDKPKFTVTAANAGQYADKLFDGHKAMFKAFPSYKMNIYESRRSCTVPQFVQAATKNNALVAELTKDGEGVLGGIIGTPFPITTNAMEMVW